ncbi:MAG: hypothetical protein J5793_03105, partial [Clostridia bacterium]|nr:hypothetical protein [Clostridia bacterium]
MDLNAKKRILMFGLSSYPGGIENFAFNCFCREEFAKKFRIDFAVCDGGLAKRSEFLSAGHGEILLPNPKKDPRGYSAKVSELIENGGYDIVYVNMLSAANIIPVNIAAKKGVKSIVVHSHADSTVPGLLRKALHYINRRSCAKKATLRLACSEKAGKWIFGKRGFTVVPKELGNLNALMKRRLGARSNGVSYITQRGAAAYFTADGRKAAEE